MSTTFSITNKQASHNWSKKELIILGVIVLAIITYLAFRFTGIQPVVMSDEQRFSTYSRILGPAQADVPSYLFYFIYHITNQCGAGFLECGRLLNLLQLVLASALLYALCKKYLSKGTSAFIAIVTLLAPWGSYITYYMPEILYYLIFLVLTWITLNEENYRNQTLFDFASGMALGILSLIKPHALFLVPAYAAFRIYANILNIRQRSLFKLACSIGLTVILLFLVRLSIGYLIAGHAALSLFGSTYSGVADKSGGLFSSQMLLALFYVAKGHAYGLLVLFGLPLMAAFIMLCNKTTDDNRELKKIIFFAGAVLICMLAVTIAYTARVNGMNQYESLNRLHMRYYFFVFPIFSVIAAFFFKETELNLAAWQKIIAALVLIATLYAGFKGLKPYTPSAVDSPDLWSIAYRPKVLHAFTLLQAFALLLFIIKPAKASKFFVYLLLPLLALNAALTLPIFFSYYRVQSAADKAGIFYEMTIGNRDPVAIVTDDDSNATRVIFHLDAKDIRKVLTSASQTLNSQMIAPDVRWIIALNDNPLAPSLRGYLAYEMPGYKIWHVGTSSYDVDFTSQTWPEVDSIKGVFSPEWFGRWSDGKSVAITFTKDIPADISLEIKAFGFGPNIGQPVGIQIGDQVEQFKLSKDLSSATLSYHNISAHTRTVIIRVPHPISPKEIGMNTDSRMLGIGLNHLSIEPTISEGQGVTNAK
jgi:phosphoglycerol transferase